MAALLDNGIPINTVISNVRAAPGINAAEKRGVKCVVAESTKEVCEAIEKRKPDLVCLAGFMRILPDHITREYSIMNIHPSLLPHFPGLHAQRQALAAGATYSGCTVHMVDGGVDTGKIVTQRSVPVLRNDTEETLSARILEEEHKAYAIAVELFMQHSRKTTQSGNIAVPARFCESFDSSNDAIIFALKRTRALSTWSGAQYVWRNDGSVIVSKEYPDGAPCIAVTSDDNYDDATKRLKNMVGWQRNLLTLQ